MKFNRCLKVYKSVTTKVFWLKAKNNLKSWFRLIPGLDIKTFICVHRTIMFTSTCTFHTPCLLQFPQMEVLKGVNGFLSFCRTINHDSESWWLCNCGQGLHNQGLSLFILSLSNIRQSSTTFTWDVKSAAVVSPSYCVSLAAPLVQKWWNSFSFLSFVIGSLGYDSVEMFETLVTLMKLEWAAD